MIVKTTAAVLTKHASAVHKSVAAASRHADERSVERSFSLKAWGLKHQHATNGLFTHYVLPFVFKSIVLLHLELYCKAKSSLKKRLWHFSPAKLDSLRV